MMEEKVDIFLDSGAPSLYNFHIRSKKSSGVHAGAHLKNRVEDNFEFLNEDLYKDTRKSYIEFIKEHLDVIDVYANFDVVNNAEETFQNQLLLESHGLKPIPVFHIGSDLKYFEYYLEKGYDYIALGGITPNPPSIVEPLLDDLFRKFICNKDGSPKIKIHGFAMTGFDHMLRYPWYSVDSTSWVLTGRFGGVWIPRFVSGEWMYDRRPFTVSVSDKSKSVKDEGKHISNLTPDERQILLNYLDNMKIPLGSLDRIRKVDDNYKIEPDKEFFVEKKKGNKQVCPIKDRGISNDYKFRDRVNIKFMIEFEKNIPSWPNHKFPYMNNRSGFGKKKYRAL